MCGRGCAWQGGMHGEDMHDGGACVAGGECMAWGRGECMARGHVWWGDMCGGGMHGRGACMAREACMAGETATAAGGTHPTGMHSCLKIKIEKYKKYSAKLLLNEWLVR